LQWPQGKQKAKFWPLLQQGMNPFGPSCFEQTNHFQNVGFAQNAKMPKIPLSTVRPTPNHPLWSLSVHPLKLVQRWQMQWQEKGDETMKCFFILQSEIIGCTA
jgi:hypothetical protein